MSLSWIDAPRFARFTKVIAVVDVVESVRLMELDEQEFIQRWHSFVDFVRQHVPLETGRIVKSLGDGLMLEFAEADGCMRMALAMQDWFEEGNLGLPPEEHVHLRVGAHFAEFVADEYDIYGTDVNLTQRIATLAGPGEIVISATMREKLGGQLSAAVEDLGACHLKHLNHTVRAYRVGRPGRAPILSLDTPARLLMRAGVAVLPFATDAMAAADVQLGEALADEAVVALARSSELQVVSRLSTARFRPPGATLDDIAQQLQPDYVLRGHASRRGEQVQVLAELTDVVTGHVVWAESLRGPLEGGEVVAALARGVTGGVTANELLKAQAQPLPVLEVHTVLLAAVALMHRLTPADLERSRALLDHLLDRNRRHASAWAWLAFWHMLQLQLHAGSDYQEVAQQARECCHNALQSDSQVGLALCLDGYTRLHLLRDPDGAGRRYAQVLAAKADDALALACGAELRALLGDSRGSCLQTARRALELCLLQPMQYFYDDIAATAAMSVGAYEEAVGHAQRCVAANPAYTAGYRSLAIALALAGAGDAAAGAARRLRELEPGFTVRRFLQRSPATPELARRMAIALASAGLPAQ
jgi:class 3 adenylate cyclase/TolB-like protein/tetratricopeptide (TPR) repeat protein